ncbi:MAG: ADP-ribosylglycohydrolase family protein [Defluviitaleaceae bacterium]|nr:ADP-ribosylglycohydrolase family protein [Defluviitaleaceae bacterium]
MQYADFSNFGRILAQISDYAALLTEYGRGEESLKIAEYLDAELRGSLDAVKRLETEASHSEEEPDDYEAILKLRKGGNVPAKTIPDLRERMAGAVMGRFAGCTLGIPVEGWSVADMKQLAEYNGMEYPPKDYWTYVDRLWCKQYGADGRGKYTRGGMDGVSVDDDITYTILGLLIIERYGFGFTTDDVGEIWKEILPYACTAEDAALRNLKAGAAAGEAALIDNPYRQWIGADIRSDGFAFAAAGDPALAAAMGYQDAYLSHRRNGIYGEMFFAAAEAAAFTVDDPIEAVRIALREIPATCALYKDIEWALETGPSIADYEAARRAVDERFAGMHPVHTNNNACLVVFGLFLGKGDFTETISNVVAMGMDNDCTGATAGSIIGAVVGRGGIAPHWTAKFNDKVRTYLIGYPELSIEDVVSRFVRLAETRMESSRA